MPEKEITEAMKMEVNNLIWMYGPHSLTLDNAENLSLAICKAILEGGIRT